ncbi:MAG: hypothetical protein JJU33_09990 [Phycisphaerales bacterium]|nr:hypothetical protein [Phycisphaerales bacterium]
MHRRQSRTTEARPRPARPLGSSRRGFTLMELFTVAAIALPLLGIMAPAMLGKARDDAKRVQGGQNLRQISIASTTYGATYLDQIPSFSWRAPRNGHQPQYPGSEFDFIRDGMERAAHDGEAAALQATEIIARRTRHAPGQIDPDWLPHELYTPLILQDFLASRVPEAVIVHPADRQRLRWQRNNGRDFLDHALGEDQPDPDGKDWRLLYSSSFLTVTGMYDAAQRDADAPARSRLRQGRTHREFLLPSGARLGGLTMSHIAFPTSKIWMHDDMDWIARNGPLHHTHPGATINTAFADGSVRSYASSELNPGWDPWRPESAEPTLYDFAPAAWDTAEPLARRPGLARWTREGIRGVDVHSAERDTGQEARIRGAEAWVRHADRPESRRAAEEQVKVLEQAEASRLRR